MHGVRETLLPPPPEDAARGLAAAGDDGAALRAVAGAHPAHSAAWAALAGRALDDGDPVAAYAFARTGYHRGLDAIRKAGWGGQGLVPWHHEPNRGFLASVFALLRAADAIGEQAEVERCRTFLLELDPDDAQGVR